MVRSGLVAMLLLSLVLSGCRPPWPACQQDKECDTTDPRNQTKQLYFCVQGRCQECRSAKDCRDPQKPKCKGHRCAPKTCEDIVCPKHQRCQPRDLSCQWVCNKDGESPCDGDRCKFCKAHQCLYTAPACVHAADCPGDLICTNPGTCHARCSAGCDPVKCQAPYECYHQTCMLLCEFSPVLFAENKFALSTKYHAYLRRVKACLDKRPDKKLQIAGHNDEFKFGEYNIHLSLRRARVIREFIKTLAVPSDRLCIVGLGQEEQVRLTPKAKSSFSVNRRATFKLVDRCP